MEKLVQSTPTTSSVSSHTITHTVVSRAKARKTGSATVRRLAAITWRSVLVADPRLSEISTSLSGYGSVDSASSHCPKARKETLFDYRQSASLTIAPWSPMKRGSSGCVRSMASSRAQPKQEIEEREV